MLHRSSIAHTLTSLLVVFALALATAACDSQGPQGPPGEDGTANVIYSDWMDADWNHTDDPRRKIMRVELDQFDYSDIRNNMLVIVYTRNYGDSSIYPMPGSGRWNEDELLYSFRFGDNQEAERGLLIAVESLDGTDLREIEYSAERGTSFRYVIIPGSVPAGDLRAELRTKLELADYEAMAAYYDIPDEGAGVVQR